MGELWQVTLGAPSVWGTCKIHRVLDPVPTFCFHNLWWWNPSLFHPVTCTSFLWQHFPPNTFCFICETWKYLVKFKIYTTHGKMLRCLYASLCVYRSVCMLVADFGEEWHPAQVSQHGKGAWWVFLSTKDCLDYPARGLLTVRSLQEPKNLCYDVIFL